MTKELSGGFTIVDVPHGRAALQWAAKIAVACRCAQEVREFGPDPEVDAMLRQAGGLASPGESTIGCLTRPYDLRAVLGVQDQPRLSTAVVSTALASLALCRADCFPVRV